MFCLIIICLFLCQGILPASDPAVEHRREFRQNVSDVSVLKAGLRDSDPVIRAYAVTELYRRLGEMALGEFRILEKEKDPMVAERVLHCLRRMKDSAEVQRQLQVFAMKVYDPRLRSFASQDKTFRFHRVKMRLSEDSTWDHEIVRVGGFEIPDSRCYFSTDPLCNGHLKNFFAAAFDDSGWKPIRWGIWENQGYPGYDGVGWYRIRFKMPAKPDCNAVELHFQAVDEEAWVWLNGRYIGQHAVGPDGWDDPFWLDVSEEIQWNEENLLVVRVKDSSCAGGIWKKVLIDILR